MRSVGVELGFEIDQNGTPGCEFLVSNGLLKFCVAFIQFGVERGGIKFFPRHCEFVDEGELKTAQTFDGGIASGLRKSRCAATSNEDCGRKSENISKSGSDA